MVNEERTAENVNPRSQEPRLVTERKINQTEGKGNEEMEDAPQGNNSTNFPLSLLIGQRGPSFL